MPLFTNKQLHSKENEIMATTENKTLFIGGFTGEKKKVPGEMFYALMFAVKPNKERENRFGWDSATVFVDKEMYQKFLISNKEMSYVDVDLLYARGGYIILKCNI